MIDELTRLELLVTTTRRLQYGGDHIDKKTESLYELHADDDGLPSAYFAGCTSCQCCIPASGFIH